MKTSFIMPCALFRIIKLPVFRTILVFFTQSACYGLDGLEYIIENVRNGLRVQARQSLLALSMNCRTSGLRFHAVKPLWLPGFAEFFQIDPNGIAGGSGF